MLLSKENKGSTIKLLLFVKKVIHVSGGACSGRGVMRVTGNAAFWGLPTLVQQIRLD